jgi:hypothetical protein
MMNRYESLYETNKSFAPSSNPDLHHYQIPFQAIFGLSLLVGIIMTNVAAGQGFRNGTSTSCPNAEEAGEPGDARGAYSVFKVTTTL